MKLEDVSKLEQTNETNKVNELLAKGYKIIKVFSTKQNKEGVEEIRPCYILGLGKE